MTISGYYFFRKKNEFKRFFFEKNICFSNLKRIDSYITLHICGVFKMSTSTPTYLFADWHKTIRYPPERAVFSSNSFMFFLTVFNKKQRRKTTRKKFYFSTRFFSSRLLVSSNSQGIDDEYLLHSYFHHHPRRRRRWCCCSCRCDISLISLK